MERALIVSGSDNGIDSLSQILKNHGYNNINVISSGNEARRLINVNDYQLVIINTPLTDEFGYELSITVSETTTAGIILICKSDILEELEDKACDFGIFIISKPLNKIVLNKFLKMIKSTRARMLGEKKENIKILSKIDDMRLINRAKCALMEYLKFTESQAHRYIEKQAMDTRQSRKEVALKILSTYER